MQIGLDILEGCVKGRGQDYVITWRQKAGPRVAAARGLSGRQGARPRGNEWTRAAIEMAVKYA